MFLVILLVSLGFDFVAVCTHINEKIFKKCSKENGNLKLHAKISV